MTSQQLTIQQITDRLAEEAGYTKGSDGQWRDDCGFSHGHPFPPDSIDAAVRGVPEGLEWTLGQFQEGYNAVVWPGGLPEGRGMIHTEASHPAHALYFAIAKARGWM